MKTQIVLVENDATVNEALCIMLQRSGFEVRAFTEHIPSVFFQITPPDLYIIDRMLSGFDGLDICRKLKATPALQNIPVIIISASAELLKDAVAAGANAWLEKPFSKRQLQEKISVLVPKAPVMATVRIMK